MLPVRTLWMMSSVFTVGFSEPGHQKQLSVIQFIYSRLSATEHVTPVFHTLPADWGWWPPSEGGFGAIMGVWLSPFSAGCVTLWSTFDSEGASLPPSTCSSHEWSNIQINHPTHEVQWISKWSWTFRNRGGGAIIVPVPCRIVCRHSFGSPISAFLPADLNSLCVTHSLLLPLKNFK